MFNKAVSVFRIKDLRRKILFTLGTIAAYRFAASVPIPGVDVRALQSFLVWRSFLRKENMGGKKIHSTRDF